MPPWDEIGYFDLPTWSGVSIGAGLTAQIAASNPMRVAIVIGVSTSSGQLSISTISTLSGTNPGLPIGSYNYPFICLQKEMGIACQSAWFGRNGTAGAAIFSVMEVVLHKWGSEDDGKQIDKLAEYVRFLSQRQQNGVK